MRLGIDHIEKPDFLVSYYNACSETYKEDTIRNGLKAIGLVPFDPNQVLA